MTTLATTTAPAIEPSNTPIPSGSAQTAHASYMTKTAGDAAEASGATATSTSTTTSSSTAAAAVADGGTNTSSSNLRILKKTMSTESVLGDDKSNAGQSSSGGGTPNAASGKQRKYERKTKRFIWPDELHRLFVAAIFDGKSVAFYLLVDMSYRMAVLTLFCGGFLDALSHPVGLKNASPKALLGVSLHFAHRCVYLPFSRLRHPFSDHLLCSLCTIPIAHGCGWTGFWSHN